VARILGLHGVWNLGYYLRGGMSESVATGAISRAWTAALTVGTTARADLRVCYYSHILNRGTAQSRDDVTLLEPGAQDLLIAWADLLNGGDRVAQGVRTVRARAAADWMTLRLPRATRAAVLAFCRELHIFQTAGVRRTRVMRAVADALAEHRPQVLVAHSLGSVVAYETLWNDPGLRVECLVTLGSPLAMPGVVFERLRPAPVDGLGARPPGVGRWINLADIGDFVAVPPRLSDRFAGIEKDVELSLGEWRLHAVRGYLAASEARAVLAEYMEPVA
jgi:hypothetical protein